MICTLNEMLVNGINLFYKMKNHFLFDIKTLSKITKLIEFESNILFAKVLSSLVLSLYNLFALLFVTTLN